LCLNVSNLSLQSKNIIIKVFDNKYINKICISKVLALCAAHIFDFFTKKALSDNRAFFYFFSRIIF